MAYNIFEVLQATSQVGSPVLLQFVMGRPGKTHLTTVSRVNATKSTFQTDFQHFRPHSHTHIRVIHSRTTIEKRSFREVCETATKGIWLSEMASGACLSGAAALKLGAEILPTSCCL